MFDLLQRLFNTLKIFAIFDFIDISLLTQIGSIECLCRNLFLQKQLHFFQFFL